VTFVTSIRQQLPSGYHSGDLLADDSRRATTPTTCQLCGESALGDRIASLLDDTGDAHLSCLVTLKAAR
jgi:hypothetical protein